MKRLKILVSAFNCIPDHGSEPAIGWGFVKAISERHDLHVLTEDAEFREKIESHLDLHPEMRRRITFHFIPSNMDHLVSGMWRPYLYLVYRDWQRKALRLARNLHERIGFDLVHHVTTCRYAEPGLLWKLPLPFVWGPTGGMENLPWRFIGSLDPAGILFHSCRNLVNSFQTRFAVSPRVAARRAGKGLIAATSENRGKLARFWGKPSHLLCEMGSESADPRSPTLREEGSPLRLSWSADHNSSKALPLLLDAAGRLNGNVDWHLDILGSGSRTEAWKRKAERLGIDGRCTWHGWIPRQEAMEVVRKSHVFVISSLADITSSVLMEAISMGVPVICLDHCGFRDVVTDECGIKIPVRTPAQVSAGIAGAIEKIGNDEPGRRRLAEGAFRRAGEFSWERKMEILNRIYADALESGRGKS
jgi:glycosyltransferase involved in cell wall biosynthesis